MFGAVAVQMMHRADLAEHVAAERQAVVDGIGLHQVEQYLLQIVVLIFVFAAGHVIGGIFAVGQITRHGAAGTAIG
ncbi:hypothetical protein D3C86_1843930 [compost metagenome]